MSNSRHQTILRLIQEQDVSTQQQLKDLLMEAGFEVTQATISRDIEQLRLRKVRASDGSKRYIRSSESNAPSKLLGDIVVSVDFAMNTVVVRCHAGTAPAAAAVFDGMKLSEVVGSIAGDDTIFLLARTEDAAKSLVKTLSTQIWG